MLRKVFSVVVMLGILAGLLGAFAPMSAQAGGPVYWEPDFSIQAYGVLKKMTAGEKYTIVVSAGSESKGPAANAPIKIEVSDGGSASYANELSSNGTITASLVYTMSGAASVTIAIDADEELTHTVKAGDNLISIAEANGDEYPEIYYRNVRVVGDDPDELKVGTVLEVVRYAPSCTLKFEVLAAEPNKVELEKPVGVIAGELPQVAGMLQDEFGNPARGKLNVSLEDEEAEVEVGTDGTFEVEFTTVYTQSMPIMGYCLSLLVEDADSLRVLVDEPFCVASAEASEMALPTLPMEVTAGTYWDAIQVSITDGFGNPVPDQVVHMNEITRTTDVNGVAIFSHTFPTQTQQTALEFVAADLSVSHMVTITPKAASEISATVQEDGSLLVYSFDEYGNARVGDAVSVTIESEGGITMTLEAVTADPTTEAEKKAEKEAAAGMPGAAPVAGEEYVVQTDDTLWDIYQALGGETGTGLCWEQWKTQTAQASGLSDPSLIHAGDVLVLAGTTATP